MTHLLILFFATFFAAFTATVPPGLLNMNAAKLSVEKGRRNGFYFSIGVAVTVTAQAYVAVLISRYLHNNSYIITVLMKIALVVFAVFAVYFFIAARRHKNKKIIVSRVSRKNSFFKGILLAMLNLLTIPYYCALNAAWNVSGWIKFEWQDILIFILAAASGTFTVLCLYVIYFNKLEASTGHFSRYANYILSALMLILVVITFVRLFYTE